MNKRRLAILRELTKMNLRYYGRLNSDDETDPGLTYEDVVRIRRKVEGKRFKQPARPDIGRKGKKK
jgi:predicted transcriptional regulator